MNLTNEEKETFLTRAFDNTIKQVPINDNVRKIPWNTLKHWMWPSNENLELAKKYLKFCGYTLVAECTCHRGIKDTTGHHHFITYGDYALSGPLNHAWRRFICNEYACTTRSYAQFRPKETFDRAVPAKCIAHGANMLLYCFKRRGSTTCMHSNPISHFDFGFDVFDIKGESTNFKEADNKHPKIIPNSFQWHAISFMKAWGEGHTKNKLLYTGPEWLPSNAKCMCKDQPIYTFKDSKPNLYKMKYYLEQANPLTPEQQASRAEYLERKRETAYIKSLPIKESLEACNLRNREARALKLDVDMSWGDSSSMVSKNT